MDEKLEQILLMLTRSAIWGKEPETKGFPLSEEEWHGLHFMARKQTVHGIVYDVVCQLPEELLPPDDLLGNWMFEVQQIERDYLRQVRTLGWLTSRLEAESDLTPIILKGLPLATFYPTPSHRYSGDIDVFYGSLDRCEKANSLVRSWGLPVMGGGSEKEYSFMLGEVEVDDAVLNQLEEGKKAASPGMKYKHYAPKANVVLLKCSDDEYIDYVNDHGGRGVAALCCDEDLSRLKNVKVISLGKRGDYSQQAHRLFDSLRRIDGYGDVITVYSRLPHTDGVGMAVYNRLIRAAGFEVIDLE